MSDDPLDLQLEIPAEDVQKVTLDSRGRIRLNYGSELADQDVRVALLENADHVDQPDLEELLGNVPRCACGNELDDDHVTREDGTPECLECAGIPMEADR